MPDTDTTQATPVVETAAPAVATPREQLYEKYYGTQQTETPAPEPVVTEPVVTEPVVTETETDAPPAEDPTLTEIRALRAELAQLRDTQAPPQVTSTATEAPIPSWVDLLREGKIEEAEAALAAKVAKQNQEKVISITEARLSAERERIQAENDVAIFIQGIRAKNPELAPMETMIAAQAAQTLTALDAQGKLKTTADRVNAYKKAVTEATESARKIAQTFRGSGKTEAQTRNKEVLSASTLAPNQVDTSGVQGTATAAPQAETVEDYFAKRRSTEARQRGL